MMLHEVFPDPDDHIRRYVRGVMFHQDAFKGGVPGQVVDLELVPEQFNRHDLQAVAVDHERARIGYLPASDAARWHDVVLAANRAGFSVWVRGELGLFDFGDEDRLVPTLFIPLNQRMCELADRFGVGTTITWLLDAVGESVRAEMLESAWDEFPRSLVKKVARHAEQFTELTWPTNPPAGLRSRVEAPGVLYPYLKALVLRQRREQAEQRHLEAGQRRAERQAEAERLRAERIRLKEEARQARQDQVRDGMERGWTNREIGADLGVSLGTVEKLKREVRRRETWDPSREERAARLNRKVRRGEAWDHNKEERAARLDRAHDALELQVQGRSRAEIGQRMSLSEATVKMLLRDAKFYIDPATDPARRRLACAAAAAQREGATRAKFQCDQGLSKPKLAEAWKDADVLEPSGNDRRVVDCALNTKRTLEE